MSAATEQQQKNNGDVVAVDKLAVVDAVKDDLKNKPAVAEDNKTNTATVAPVAADNNGVSAKDKNNDDCDANDGGDTDAAVNTSSHPSKTTPIKATKRPAEGKTTDIKKAKKDKVDEENESGEENIVYEEVNEVDSDIESDEYDLPYDGEEDDIDGEDEEDEIFDGTSSDDQA